MFKKVFLGCDHTGCELKEKLASVLENTYKIEVVNFDYKEGYDYVDAARLVSAQVKEDPTSFGLLICGSGVGVSIVANRINGIRALVASSPEAAALSRKHNNANVLCLGARITTHAENLDILEAFLTNDFEGGRHEIRVKKIDN
jgi:ribose 5-phosphate isomerase B